MVKNYFGHGIIFLGGQKMEKLIAQYENIRRRMKAYAFANNLANWDSTTEAPKGCFENRSLQMGVLSEESYKLQTGPETVSVIEALFARREELDPILKHEIAERKEALDKIKKVPMNEFVDFMTLLGSSEHVWAQAKNASDWNQFLPLFEKIFAFQKKYVKYVETKDLKGYDVLLDEFEKGYTAKEYDKFFNVLKTDLVPFVKKVLAQDLHLDDSFNKQLFPAEGQKKFMLHLQNVMNFDKDHGLMKESEHPFTTNFGASTDVRFTNHYYENMFASAIFSAIHEMGHATYEMQVNPALDQTLSGGGGSMALHESQSRFYENIIGRSKEFWRANLPALRKVFPKQLKGVTLETFYKFVNRSQASLIRTEADELTYPIHIMIRYDLERALFNDEIAPVDLPKAWNQKVKEYLGLEVPNDKEGVLQDVHWAWGYFGYFPTYALGSAYAAQIFAKMNSDFKVLKSLDSGSTKQINEWLKDRLHQFGSTKYPKELFQGIAGANFDPKYYVKYLIKKYSKIYDLKP
jgi:carboxypeptidase Taq